MEKPFKPTWTVEGRQRGKSARKKKISPVSEAGKHHPSCDWLKKWHVAAVASIEKFSKDETAHSGITSKNFKKKKNFLSLTKGGGKFISIT